MDIHVRREDFISGTLRILSKSQIMASAGPSVSDRLALDDSFPGIRGRGVGRLTYSLCSGHCARHRDIMVSKTK